MKIFLLILLPLITNANELIGKWRTNCTPFGRHAFIAEITFSKKSYIADTQMYAKDGCKLKTVRTVLHGSYWLKGEWGEGIAFDNRVESLMFTLLRPEVVKHYNRNGICSYSNWKMNTPIDVLGRANCVGFDNPKPNTMLYDLFLIEDNIVYFHGFPYMSTVRRPGDRPTSVGNNSTALFKVKIGNY